MRYFYDTEFIEDGTTIDLISMGIVAEDGRQYYAISTEFDPTKAGDWVRKHVLDTLPSPSDRAYKSRRAIRDEVASFLDPASPVELWAWVAAYDHVALCQLFGAMPALPRHIPRFTRELKQHWELAGSPPIPAIEGTAHNALDDARHNIARWRALNLAPRPHVN